MRRSKSVIVSLVVCLLIAGAWIISAAAGWALRVGAPVSVVHDGLTWQKLTVVRVCGSHLGIEWWEVPQSQSVTLAGQLGGAGGTVSSDFSQADHSLGFVAWADSEAGMATYGGSARRDGRKPRSVPAWGHGFVSVQWWFLMLLGAVPGGIHFSRRMLREQKPNPLNCRRCGYDLRATPDRCPECGTVFSRQH